MANRNQWVEFIKRGQTNRLDRIQKSLLTDFQRSLPYLEALTELSAQRSDAPLLRDLIRDARCKARELTLDQLETILDQVMNLPLSLRSNLFALICGGYRDEKNIAESTFQRLADIAEAQLGILSKELGASSASFAIYCLIHAGVVGSTSIWTNFLEGIYQRRDCSPLIRILTMLGAGSVAYCAVPYSLWTEDFNVVDVKEADINEVSVKVPVPDAMHQWFQIQIHAWVKRVRNAENDLTELAIAMRENPNPYRSAYEDMWLEMMLQPKWGLRDGGLDCVTISVPALHKAGHRWMRFFPVEPFPNFRAHFRRKRVDGGEHSIELNLEPSDLLQVNNGIKENDDSLFVWVDRVFAFCALRAVREIVMGNLSEDSASDNGRRGSAGSAIVRPRFRKLPVGFKASPEARQRALEKFRKEPLPGFTFVREHARGPYPQSGDPLFQLTELDVK